MEKAFLIFSLCFLSIPLVYPQSRIDSTCDSNIETILKAHDLKIKYEAVQSLYHVLGIEDSTVTNKRSFLHVTKSGLNTYFEAIRGIPLAGNENLVTNQRTNSMTLEKRSRYFEQWEGSQSELKPVPVEPMSDEEMTRYVEQINCTPQEALEEYLNLIREIKSKREMYLKCIDLALADDLSDLATAGMLYTFIEPGNSISGLPWKFTKLDFLKVFKEFVLNDDVEILPDGMRAYAYLNCGCKIPSIKN